MNVDVHYVSVTNVTEHACSYVCSVRIEIIIISFEHIGSHFEFMQIV